MNTGKLYVSCHLKLVILLTARIVIPEEFEPAPIPNLAP